MFQFVQFIQLFFQLLTLTSIVLTSTCVDKVGTRLVALRSISITCSLRFLHICEFGIKLFFELLECSVRVGLKLVEIIWTILMFLNRLRTLFLFFWFDVTHFLSKSFIDFVFNWFKKWGVFLSWLLTWIFTWLFLKWIAVGRLLWFYVSWRVTLLWSFDFVKCVIKLIRFTLIHVIGSIGWYYIFKVKFR